MAARGSAEKEKIFSAIKDFYQDAFWEKEGQILRIPMNGIEIKVTLTAATNLLQKNEPIRAQRVNVSPILELTPEEEQEVIAYAKTL